MKEFLYRSRYRPNIRQNDYKRIYYTHAMIHNNSSTQATLGPYIFAPSVHRGAVYIEVPIYRYFYENNPTLITDNNSSFTCCCERKEFIESPIYNKNYKQS